MGAIHSQEIVGQNGARRSSKGDAARNRRQLAKESPHLEELKLLRNVSDLRFDGSFDAYIIQTEGEAHSAYGAA